MIKNKNNSWAYENRKIKKPSWGTKTQVLKERGYKCCSCGDDYKHNTILLHIHHLDFSGMSEHPNNTKKNLVCLCRQCHADEHNKRRYLTREGKYSKIVIMNRKKWIEKVEKRLRNELIARLYFLSDLSSIQIQREYFPELGIKRIFAIARDYVKKYGIPKEGVENETK